MAKDKKKPKMPKAIISDAYQQFSKLKQSDGQPLVIDPAAVQGFKFNVANIPKAALADLTVSNSTDDEAKKPKAKDKKPEDSKGDIQKEKEEAKAKAENDPSKKKKLKAEAKIKTETEKGNKIQKKATSYIPSTHGETEPSSEDTDTSDTSDTPEGMGEMNAAKAIREYESAGSGKTTRTAEAAEAAEANIIE